jgi:hypothetical protein
MSRLPIPSTKRFRDFRVYGVQGTRYLDLWQNNGRGFWGHTPRGLSQVLKNAVSPGLYSPFPHPHFSRIQKRVRQLFPGWEPWVFPQISGITDWLKILGFPPVETPDQLFHGLEWFGVGNKTIKARTIRPGILDPLGYGYDYSLNPSIDHSSIEDYDILIPQLPLPADWMGNLVLVQEQKAQELFQPLIGQSSQVSGIQVTTLVWLLDTLLRIPSGWRPWASGQGLPPPGQDLTFPGFSRIGRYLVPQMDLSSYILLHTKAKQQGILLNPRSYHGFPGISILPGYGSHGEWAKVRAVLCKPESIGGGGKNSSGVIDE